MASVTLPNTVTIAGQPGFVQSGEAIPAGRALRMGSDGRAYKASNSDVLRSVVFGMSLVASVAAGQWISYAPPGSIITGASGLTKGSSYLLDHGTDEVQTVTVTGIPTGGTFTLTYAGVASVAIAYNAAGATVQAALEGITGIGAGNVTVTGTGPYTVTFKNVLGGLDVSPLALGTNALTGGTAPSVSVVETTPGVAAGSPCPYADLVTGNYIVHLLIALSTTSCVFDPVLTGTAN